LKQRGLLSGLLCASADHLIIGEALVGYLRKGHFKAIRVSNEVLPISAIVVTKYLLIEVTKQVERFNGNIGAFQAALYKTPKVLKAVRV
jgi:hypothetical protein